MVAMTHPDTGLPADNITGDLSTRSGYTSPTNIGGLMWSAVAAREMGIITPHECTRVVRRTMRTLLQMEHHEPSGMYFNWYDEATGKALRRWPTTGDRIFPFVSSVDNGWLGAALWVVRNSVPGAAGLADRLFRRMRWDAFYNPDAARPGGLMHGGFFPYRHDRPGGVYRGSHIDAPDVWLTTHPLRHHRLGEPDHVLPGHHDRPGAARALLRGRGARSRETCDWSWHEMQPVA
jgi:hypothetical protein